jgi:hypothetical protein
MKKFFLYALSILAGFAIGYFVGSTNSLSGSPLFWEIFYGVFLFFSIANAFADNNDKYGVLAGAVIGLLITISLDLIAGSPLVMTNKLIYMSFGSFVGWGYGWGRVYWRFVCVGGFIVGLLGFVLGYIRIQQFGYIVLMPGLLNAGLTFVRLCIVGMAFASLYLKSFGWRYMKSHM